MWQFVTMVFDLGFYEVQNRRVDFSPLAPNGELFVRRQFTDGPEPFGYWEDV